MRFSSRQKEESYCRLARCTISSKIPFTMVSLNIQKAESLRGVVMSRSLQKSCFRPQEELSTSKQIAGQIGAQSNFHIGTFSCVDFVAVQWSLSRPGCVSIIDARGIQKTRGGVIVRRYPLRVLASK